MYKQSIVMWASVAMITIVKKKKKEIAFSQVYIFRALKANFFTCFCFPMHPLS